MSEKIVFIDGRPYVHLDYDNYSYRNFQGYSLNDDSLSEWENRHELWENGYGEKPEDLSEVTRPVLVYEAEYITEGDNGYFHNDFNYQGEALYRCPGDDDFLIVSLSYEKQNGYYEEFEQDGKKYLLFDNDSSWFEETGKEGAMDFLEKYNYVDKFLELFPDEVEIA